MEIVSNTELDIIDLNEEIRNSSLTESMNYELQRINDSFSAPLIKKIPITEMAELGAVFADLIPYGAEAAGTVVENGGLFRCVFPEGVVGQLAQSAGERIGGIMVEGGGLAQARWIPVTEGAKDVGAAAAVANPEVLLIAVAVIGISLKINEIKKGQEKIVAILERDKKSQLIADYELLQDYLDDYRYYFENANTMTVNLNQVKNIKRNALKDVKSYQEELYEKVNGKNNILTMISANSEIKTIFDRFVHYKLAISVYSMACYLEIMLAKNFYPEYLDKEMTVMRGIAEEYNEIYLSCNEKLSELKVASIGSKTTKGLSWLSKNAGNVIGKIPVVEKGTVDEALIVGSEKLTALDEKSLNGMIEFFEEYKECAVLSISDHIDSLMKLANKKTEIITDGNVIYFFSENA